MTEPGLRERKRARTRRAIQEAALRLIDERGYDATTVQQIAAAAEVSPSTCFRYFPTKEDIILRDEYDPQIFEALVADPSGSPIEVLRSALGALFGRIWAEDRELVYRRVRLCLDVPPLRARMSDGVNDATRMVCEALAARFEIEPDDFELEVAAAAAMGVMTRIYLRWAEAGGTDDLPEQVDRALLLLEQGLSPQAPARRR